MTSCVGSSAGISTSGLSGLATRCCRRGVVGGLGVGGRRVVGRLHRGLGGVVAGGGVIVRARSEQQRSGHEQGEGPAHCDDATCEARPPHVNPGDSHPTLTSGSPVAGPPLRLGTSEFGGGWPVDERPQLGRDATVVAGRTQLAEQGVQARG